jgi:hypothetical protein
MREDDKCANCGNDNFEVDHYNANIVCNTCGLVVPHSNLSDYLASAPYDNLLRENPQHRHKKPRISNEVRAFLDREQKSAKYKHVTYARELWRLVKGEAPVIPDEDFGLIAALCRRRHAHGATKDELRKVLHDIDVYKRKLGERGYFVQKYLVRHSISLREIMIHLGVCVHGTL